MFTPASLSMSIVTLVLLGLPAPALAAELTAHVACPQPLARAGAQSVASYRVFASLDPDRHRVAATAIIRWQNPSLVPTDELYLHAYLNAFAHPRTRFLRTGSRGRRFSVALAAPGGLALTRLVARELGNVDLLPQVAAYSPGDPDDATDLRIQLPAPIAPGAMLTLDLDFQANLPALVERSGYSGSFHAVTQWFPKLAYRDRDGTWHHFPYAPLAEFSSDFGDYDVTLDVPSNFVVAAPGVASVEPAAPNRRRERYCVGNAHDFAWFAWDRFVLTKARAGVVELRHYASSEQTANAIATLDAARWGLDYFGVLLGPYPYESLTIVHPPDRALAAGGMEYPQLIATGGSWLLPYLGFRATQAVAMHELAHQWFYGIVASDEYLDPVLDEGLASWAESKALDARFGIGSTYDSNWFRFTEAATRRVQARKYSRSGPLALTAGEFADFPALSARIYSRFPTLLETLERVYGHETIVAAIRAYVEQYWFGHPTPRDFLAAVGPHLPARAVDTLSRALFTDGWVDFAVTRITSTQTDAPPVYANRILIERHGTLDLPVQLEVVFSDGRRARRQVDSVSSSSWIDWPDPSPIVAATLDPDHRITIDDNLDNQTLRIAKRPVSIRLAAALHHLLSAILSLGWP